MFSMITTDNTLIQAFADIEKFFERIMAGELETMPLGISTAEPWSTYTSGVKHRKSWLFDHFCGQIIETKLHSSELLKNYTALAEFAKLIPRNFMLTWEFNKKPEAVVVSDDNLIAAIPGTETFSVFIDLKFNSNRFYFEIEVLQGNENKHIGICDAKNEIYGAWNSSFFSVSYQPNGGVFLAAASQFTFEAYKPGDKIRIFIDMAQKKIVFYKNKVKQTGLDQRIAEQSHW